jgi:DNA segregation ATPase FtsK/SpoIIIE-like protein
MTSTDTPLSRDAPGNAFRSFRFSDLCWYLVLLAVAFVLALLQPVVWAQQPAPQGEALDPPGRVARLNLAEGAVSFAPGDANDAWTPAVLNRPLTAGDRLWTGPQARSELYVGSSAVRMNAQTSLDFLALDDNTTQLRLAQGTLKLRVRTLFEGQRLEIDTPNLAFVVSQAGDYRLDVDPAGNTTRVVAQSGGGVIYGDGAASVNLADGQQANFSGTQLVPAGPGAARQDDFDVWAADRDRREDQSVSARYVPRETVGYQQLDSYGNWSQDPTYGAVWMPRAVPVNWAPYRVGHWAWVSPWGWTWVDDAPWGFAPFHYGRWAQIGPRWAWVPGRLAPRPVYAPALVAFVGGSSGGVNWNISVGGAARPGVGWFPLAPGEAFRPAYRVSPRYVTQVNHNIVVNNTVNITNVYRYQRQPAAVTAVSRDDFERGRPVHGNQHRLSSADLGRAQLVADRAALPQRPNPAEIRERQRPVAAATLPPPAVAARTVVSRRDARRDDDKRDTQRADRRDAPTQGRPDAGRDHDARPQPTAPAAPVAAGPAARPAPAPDRNAQEASQRAQRQQKEELQAPQLEQQRRQGEEAIGQRALREQAQRDARAQTDARAQAANANARASADRHAAEQAQREQQRQLREQKEKLQAPQLEQQRRQGEEAIGQRALREQAQRDQENTRQQQAAQKQQQQQQQQRPQQDQQRQAQEQQQRRQQPSQQPQSQRDAAPGKDATPDRPARQADATNPRGPRGEGGPNRDREQ